MLFFQDDPLFIFMTRKMRDFLDPHQETNQCAKDFLFIWAPIFDAIGDQGGLDIYKKSHKHGYWKHSNSNKLGSSHLKEDVLNKFEKQRMEVESGSALLIHSALIHGSVKTTKEDLQDLFFVTGIALYKKYLT